MKICVSCTGVVCLALPVTIVAAINGNLLHGLYMTSAQNIILTQTKTKLAVCIVYV